MTAASRYASKQRSRARSNALVNATVEERVSDVLDGVIDAVQDLSDAWPAVGEVFAERQRGIFATGSNGRWATLAASTILRKRRLGQPATTLVATGSLLAAVSSATPRASGPRFAVYGPPKGADLSFAKHHIRGNGVPQRNPVPRLTPIERKRMVEAIRERVLAPALKAAA